MATRRKGDPSEDRTKQVFMPALWLRHQLGGFGQWPRWQRWATYAGVLVLLGVCGGFIALAVAERVYGRDLPDIAWAERYRPPIVSDVLSGDDQLLGEFYNERRRVVPYERIPKKLVQAFIAAEDNRFFDHSGVDVFGIARAVVQNILAGRKKSGASTLTQQTAKAILISTWGFERATQKSYKRKIFEAILARRLEARFTKEEILALYLNQVYLGHSSYGVQAAAENYFRKNVWDLSLGEMALLAGLPQAPSKYSPFKHADRAKARRKYVLRQMLDNGMITQPEHDEALEQEPVVYPVEDFFHETAPFVTEHVRRDVLARYSNERLLTDGLKITTTVDLELEREAIAASLRGLLAADKRQGYRGPLMKVEPKAGGKPGSKAWVSAQKARIDDFLKSQRTKGAAPESADAWDGTQTVVGIVTAVAKDRVDVSIGDKLDAVLPLELMKWARKPNSEVNVQYWAGIGNAADALDVGDVILVRKATDSEAEAQGQKRKAPAVKGKPAPEEPADRTLYVALEQEPSLQGALVSMDPKSGYIVAMIGGYDFEKSEFNRAFQACRQPGSAFKPVYYSAALDGQVRVDNDPKCRRLGASELTACMAEVCLAKGASWMAERHQCTFTPSTPLLDAPIVYDDAENAVRWKPSNFEEKFMGDVPLRFALMNSMNIPAVHTLEAVGVKEAAAWARRLGITSTLNEDLSIALGSSCVTLWDLTHVYAVFNQMGLKVKSTFIRRVMDRDGRVLEDHSSFYDPWTDLHTRVAAGYSELFEERERLVNADSAYVLTTLLEAVARGGTAARAASMGRNIAGKTGTTNDAFDAWFMGYTPEFVTGVWVGYDTYEMPMGKYETGGHTALPIWMDYMEDALKGRPNRAFWVPDGVSFVHVDPNTGKRVSGDAGIVQAFRSGTEPPEPGTEPARGTPSGDLFRTQEL